MTRSATGLQAAAMMRSECPSKSPRTAPSARRTTGADAPLEVAARKVPAGFRLSRCWGACRGASLPQCSERFAESFFSRDIRRSHSDNSPSLPSFQTDIPPAPRRAQAAEDPPPKHDAVDILRTSQRRNRPDVSPPSRVLLSAPKSSVTTPQPSSQGASSSSRVSPGPRPSPPDRVRSRSVTEHARPPTETAAKPACGPAARSRREGFVCDSPVGGSLSKTYRLLSQCQAFTVPLRSPSSKSAAPELSLCTGDHARQTAGDGQRMVALRREALPAFATPESGAQTLTVPSSDALAALQPSGEKATAHTDDACPEKTPCRATENARGPA